MPQSTGSFQHRLLRLSGVLLATLLMLIPPNLQADQQGALPSIRIAALKFGTLNWELDTMVHQGFDRNNGFQLSPLNLATVTATRTALLSGNSDVIVADWLWVSRQRDRGMPLQFIPYSTSIGKLMLAKGSPIQGLEDLSGKRIGIAGGPVDKGWLLLQAWALQQGIDLKQNNELQFAAPPLLNATLQQGELDAVLTFWHYAARLKGQGHQQLLDMGQISAELGLGSGIPMLGLVFRQGWAEKNPALVQSLAKASRQTKHFLRDNPTAWNRLRPLMRAKQESVFTHLKTGFISGIPAPVSGDQYQVAERMFKQLAKTGGPQLVGTSTRLDRNSFWRPSDALRQQTD